MRKVNVQEITQNLKEMCIEVNHFLSPDMKRAILEAAKNEKDEAIGALNNAEKAVVNLDSELNTILNEAEKSAEVIGEKILTEAKKQIESIEANAIKVIEAEEKLLISKLTKSTSKASVQIAKSHVEKVLQETPTLHDKYIDESIDELDRLSL